ncbi:hypothetical protein [Lentzea aerocolonigenes]|uniref:hypothetical protein n=1 Tax=Lentzea aerocolonigenes TaxID=68170 RepID=UPI0012E239D3|nr:hypothetical protein [Lentzea aerocolonigenes]
MAQLLDEHDQTDEAATLLGHAISQHSFDNKLRVEQASVPQPSSHSAAVNDRRVATGSEIEHEAVRQVSGAVGADRLLRNDEYGCRAGSRSVVEAAPAGKQATDEPTAASAWQFDDVADDAGLCADLYGVEQASGRSWVVGAGNPDRAVGEALPDQALVRRLRFRAGRGMLGRRASAGRGCRRHATGASGDRAPNVLMSLFCRRTLVRGRRVATKNVLGNALTVGAVRRNGLHTGDRGTSTVDSGVGLVA